ncbi:MAG: sensor histidine kinase, partial [Leucobacter sp.]
AQERLRVATDVHDLQGHHLQVIALQLELAEKLAPRDPAASLEQLRAARRSVDEAMQGTRDLALQFRSVPLQDELANAVDLLRAAGLSVETSVDAHANQAPAATLGPVIRETTTNVLRHGAGKHARLALTDTGSEWQYEISNDRALSVDPHTAGSGLEGIERRVTEANGSLEVRQRDTEFTAIVTVPKRWEEAR